ncbi:tRNA (34-2'-O)-methyltransferase regulator WDR6-like [Ptychodera flava]|uniref:tRNA (34-2'-O)-methyltransferase regulator WDR6-like n=1 Tax=Ptychodera flava TaxID=63121 RepID=UPI00396AA1B8
MADHCEEQMVTYQQSENHKPNIFEVRTYTGPVTALAIQQDYILSGEGPYLKVYSISDGRQVIMENALHWCNIHGIRKGPSDLFAVYGQKALCVLQLDLQSRRITVKRKLCEVADWIKDVQWLKNEDHLAIALAHNSIALFDWKSSKVIEHVHCEDKCILYSATIIGNSWSSLVVAVGTVFNQVVLWKPTGDRTESNQALVEKRLCGHEGVIFSISFSEKYGKLCSVSDDRSIRIWDMKDPEHLNLIPTIPLLVLYGHSARVWDAVFMDKYIVSIGEDATCCLWDYHGNILTKFKGHKGSSIWSLATSEDLQVVVTGGGDCSIRMWSLISWQQKDIQTVQLDSPSDFTDCPRHVCVLKTGIILILTDLGIIHSYDVQTKQWDVLLSDSNYGSYALLSPSPNHQLVAMANIAGFLKIFVVENSSQLSEVKVYEGKVLSLCWASNQDIFTSGPDGMVTWWKVQLSSQQLKVNKLQCYLLPYARQRWVTAVSILDSNKGLVIGDRRGTVHLYQSETKETDQAVGPTQSLVTVHGKGGVTDACCHGDFIYTAGKDGTYKQYSYQDNHLHLLNSSKVYKGFEWLEKLTFTESGDLNIQGFHTTSFVVWSVHRNERLLQIQCGGGHRSYGYANVHNDAIFVYIKARNVILCQIAMDALQAQTVIKESFHWREITSVCYLDTIYLSPNTQHNILATASEDTKINIMAITQNNAICKQKTLKCLHSHISSVRTLQVCSLPSSGDSQSMSKLLFSAGGRAALKCWKVRVMCKEQQTPSNDTLEESTFLDCSVELLGCYGTTDGRQRRQHKWQGDKDVDDIDDTRHMSMTAWQGPKENIYYLAVCSSDAFVRLLSFDYSCRKFSLLGQSSWHEHCVLVTTHHILSHDSNVSTSSSGDSAFPIMLFTGGTDGRIACWDVMPATVEHDKCISQRKSDEESDTECNSSDSNGECVAMDTSHKMTEFQTNCSKSDSETTEL